MSQAESPADTIQDETNDLQESADQPSSHIAGYLARVPQWLTVWVPTVTAVVAMALSLYTLAATSATPDVRIIMPEKVRVAQGGESGAFVYLRPTWLAHGSSERTEVVTGVRLVVERLGASQDAAAFAWDEQGDWHYDPVQQTLTWVFTGDPGPFLIAPEEAEIFTGLFVGPRDFRFVPGRYRLTLVGERAVAERPVSASMEIVLEEDAVAYLDEAQGTRFLEFAGVTGAD